MFSSDYTPPAASPARFPTRLGIAAPPQTQTPPDEALTPLQGEHHSSIPPTKTVDHRLSQPCRREPHDNALYLDFSLLQKCEHNLSKPEFNPTSIKFKIQLVAVWVSTNKNVFYV